MILLIKTSIVKLNCKIIQKSIAQEDSEISRILETTQNEMTQRVSGEVDNRENPC